MPQRTRFATHQCACGCEQHPRGRQSEYIRAHRPVTPLADRLWSRVERMPNGCWEWQGARDGFGYGKIKAQRPRRWMLLTHRAAWEITHGPIPDGMLVRHRCDNPPCINPTHLELGTDQDNSNDAVARGRTARGQRLSRTKLTEENVREIRRALATGEVQRVVAERYGVSRSLVGDIASGRRWKWVA